MLKFPKKGKKVIGEDDDLFSAITVNMIMVDISKLTQSLVKIDLGQAATGNG